MSEAGTFSIVARCAQTGQLGVAVATAVPAVGGICPYVQSGLGAASTQSWVNPYLALTALAKLEKGADAAQALAAALAADDARESRQIGLVDARGGVAVHTGADCTPWAGQIVGAGAVVTRDVPAFALVVGNPARQTGWMCRCGEKLKMAASASSCSLVKL